MATYFCSHCAVEITLPLEGNIPHYCPYCGQEVHTPSEESTSSSLQGMTSHHASIVPGAAPEEEPVAFSLGPYQVLRKIGQGGMGEVFLAYDTVCGRRIALKRIRSDLTTHPYLYSRFLKEARITGQLTHPSIIPIYAIHQEKEHIYYTMPYVEGETVKQMLRDTKQRERRGDSPHPIGDSIPALMRILLSICHAVSYAHSHGVLHRDIKPENIIIGKFGEVFILDWGLAKVMEGENEPSFPEEKTPLHRDESYGGKIVGTVSYMAPERALGFPATIQTDIYSLGIILYTFLALRLPFRRKSIKEFKKKMHQEQFVDPAEIAPYRDVPQMLSQVAARCLAPAMEERYTSVEELIHDIESYLEGGSEWFFVAELDIDKPEDWEFQENVLLPGTLAITRNAEETEWVSLMISKASFTGNTRLEATVQLGELSQGIGFLLKVPEASQRTQLTDGYCLWMGSDTHRATKLLRSSVEVVHAPEIYLQRGKRYQIRIEQHEQNIAIYLNDVLQFSYLGLMPLIGTHVGLLARDHDFSLHHWSVSVRSLSVMVNCLAIPDAFLAYKEYDKAFSEYQRISYSFPGRMEGREALFRAGFTLIAQAQQADNSVLLLERALNEFEELHGTPGAPLEYLGKALVYQQLDDIEEEIKCFELALRRYPAHPLLPILQEQILFRLHKSSRIERKATYQFVLLAKRQIPQENLGENTLKLFQSLQKNWELLHFLEPDTSDSNAIFAVILAFWLHKPHVLHEILRECQKCEAIDASLMDNILFFLLVMGEKKDFQEEMIHLQQTNNFSSPILEEWLEASLLPISEQISQFFLKHPQMDSFATIRMLDYLLQQALEEEAFSLVVASIEKCNEIALPSSWSAHFDAMYIEALLWENRWDEAGRIFQRYNPILLNQETSLLHTLYGCWLAATEGPELAEVHFRAMAHVSYPRSWALLGHYLTDSIKEESSWFRNAFPWERKQLYRQLALYFHVLHNEEKSRRFREFATEYPCL